MMYQKKMIRDIDLKNEYDSVNHRKLFVKMNDTAVVCKNKEKKQKNNIDNINDYKWLSNKS